MSVIVSEIARLHPVLDPTAALIFHDLAPSIIASSWACSLSFSWESFPQTYDTCWSVPHPLSKQMNLSSPLGPVFSPSLQWHSNLYSVRAIYNHYLYFLNQYFNLICVPNMLV